MPNAFGVSLSEDTRLGTVRVTHLLCDMHYDVSQDVFVLCEQGNYHILAIFRPLFWQALGEEF